MQELGRCGVKDPDNLSFAAERGLVMIGHDRKTLIKAAYERIVRGEPFPGLIILDQIQPSAIIDDIVLLVLAGRRDDLENRVQFLPLR